MVRENGILGRPPWPPLCHHKAPLQPQVQQPTCAISVLPQLDGAEKLNTEQMHRLVKDQAGLLSERPSLMYHQGDARSQAIAREFSDSCVLSLAIWRRFGTADFAHSLGWLKRTDYAAMVALLDGPRAIDAAVAVWRSGKNAVGGNTMAQRCTQLVELRAWELGACTDPVIFSQTSFSSSAISSPTSFSSSTHLGLSSRKNVLTEAVVQSRANQVTVAGEAAVRGAYARLLNARHHPIWDLWRKRELVSEAALDTGSGLEGLRKALLQVKGYCGPDKDSDCAGWELAFDIRTVTPLSSDMAPIHANADYVAWLRQRQAKHCLHPAAAFSRTAPCPSPRRPPVSVSMDWTGFG